MHPALLPETASTWTEGMYQVKLSVALQSRDQNGLLWTPIEHNSWTTSGARVKPRSACPPNSHFSWSAPASYCSAHDTAPAAQLLHSLLQNWAPQGSCVLVLLQGKYSPWLMGVRSAGSQYSPHSSWVHSSSPCTFLAAALPGAQKGAQGTAS